MSVATRFFLIVLTVAYPFLVYFAVQRDIGKQFVFVLVPIGVIHLYRALAGTAGSWIWVSACLVLACWSWFYDSPAGVKFYPVVINLGMLVTFLWSLYRPPSVIERIARLREPDLPESGVRYTRNVTRVWCFFFALNALIAGLTMLAADWVWALYNGFLAYLLMALLFGGEWLVRLRYRSRHNE